MTEQEAARRLGMSVSWFKSKATTDVFRIVRRGRQPAVDWGSVEKWMDRTRL